MSSPEKLPLLLVSDAPNLPTGLGRITRDLAWRISSSIPEVDLAYLGWDWDESLNLPWKNFPITDHDNWGRDDLEKVWWKAFGKRKGVIFTVWDPARAFALLEESGEVPAQLWGYFPIDGVNMNGSIGGPAAAAIRKYRRVLGYGEFGAKVLARVLGEGARVESLPHGLDLSVWKPRRAPEGLVGIVATNTHRKDWGLGFQAFREMKKTMPRLRLWAHVNSEVTVAWSLPELAEQCGLGAQDLIVTSSEKGGLPDEHLANLYSACVVTLGIGLGEGFGYPLVESLACGRPVVHCDYAGGAELVPVPAWRVRARAFHVESAYALHRPIIDPDKFAGAALAAAEWGLAEPEISEAYCAGSVQHLGWDSLWPHWERWIRAGFAELI